MLFVEDIFSWISMQYIIIKWIWWVAVLPCSVRWEGLAGVSWCSPEWMSPTRWEGHQSLVFWVTYDVASPLVLRWPASIGPPQRSWQSLVLATTACLRNHLTAQSLIQNVPLHSGNVNPTLTAILIHERLLVSPWSRRLYSFCPVYLSLHSESQESLLELKCDEYELVSE